MKIKKILTLSLTSCVAIGGSLPIICLSSCGKAKGPNNDNSKSALDTLNKAIEVLTKSFSETNTKTNAEISGLTQQNKDLFEQIKNLDTTNKSLSDTINKLEKKLEDANNLPTVQATFFLLKTLVNKNLKEKLVSCSQDVCNGLGNLKTAMQDLSVNSCFSKKLTGTTPDIASGFTPMADTDVKASLTNNLLDGVNNNLIKLNDFISTIKNDFLSLINENKQVISKDTIETLNNKMKEIDTNLSGTKCSNGKTGSEKIEYSLFDIVDNFSKNLNIKLFYDDTNLTELGDKMLAKSATKGETSVVFTDFLTNSKLNSIKETLNAFKSLKKEIEEISKNSNL